MLRSRLAAAIWLAVLFGSGCMATVVDRSHRGLADRRTPIRKIAVAPLRAGPEHAQDGALLLSRQLAEALAARGVDVVAPEDVARIATTAEPTAAELAGSVSRKFAADAVLVGEVTRWVEREGEALGSQNAAAVGVQVVLYGAPDGVRLWEGSFDHTQQPFLENVLVTPQYPGRGTRWLSAPEFARFAAQELAARVPVTP